MGRDIVARFAECYSAEMRDVIDGIAWLWGDGWIRHATFIAGVVIGVGALMQGWIEADNAIRINRRLRGRD
jgi:hypothetical protein